MISAYLANRIWLLSQQVEYRRFLKACERPEAAQLAKLKGYLQQNRDTAFGLQFGFKKITDYQGFAKRVPIQTWADIQPWIDRILKGEQAVLTQEAVNAFEKTSGTTSMAKLVPYTATLRQEFQRGVAAWISAMFRAHPAAFAGPSYWSISPATTKSSQTDQGIPIGLESDGEYFDPFSRYLLSRIWAISPGLHQESKPERFYMRSLQELLMQEKLSMISVWSPSFLMQLDAFLQQHSQELIDWLQAARPGNSRRRSFLLDILPQRPDWGQLFPRLRLMSCWAHAQAEWLIPSLKTRLGAVPIQPKGLLATEGITSIPVRPDLDPVMSLRSHFYEFRSAESGEVKLAHQLQVGESYELILSTGGGLYRYASGDLVRVTGFYGRNPALRFLGRAHRQSDLVGEKLSEPQVLMALSRIPAEISARLRAVFIRPLMDNGSSQYQLCLGLDEGQMPSRELESLAQRVESALEENPYYAQALRLGQLKPLQAHLLPMPQVMALERFLKQGNRIKDGDFKMPVLFRAGELDKLPTSSRE